MIKESVIIIFVEDEVEKNELYQGNRERWNCALNLQVKLPEISEKIKSNLQCV